MRRTFVTLLVAAGVLYPAAIAHGHAQFLDSDPATGAKLDEAPTSIRLEYSEPPVSADNVVVKDGCGVDVVTAAEVEEKAITADVPEGQPGKWKVSFRVISAVDGHPNNDSFSFTVAGKADCTKETGAAPPREDDGGDSGLPILLALGGATVVIVLGALLLRKRS